MELIPILATIILVATISTFFLSIGAYILFKIREAQGVRQKAVPPATIHAELVTPELASERTSATMSTRESQRRTGQTFETTHAPEYRATSSPSRVTGNLGGETVPAAQQYAPPRREAPISAVTTNAKKFVKVTSESAQEQQQQQAPQQQRQGGNLKWR
ncbi:hypothetical protein MASR1M107_33230 [Ignavibacteriales bacterium]